MKRKTSEEQQQQRDLTGYQTDPTIVLNLEKCFRFRGQTGCGNKGGPTIIMIKKNSIQQQQEQQTNAQRSTSGEQTNIQILEHDMNIESSRHE